MKNTTNRLMIAAAFLAVATGVASAEAMTADIPFTFRAGNTVMAPGAYLVDVKEANGLVFLSNREARQGAVMLSNGSGDVDREWKAKGDAVLAFECGSGPCALTRVWTASGTPALSFPRAGVGAQHAALTLIRLVRTSGN